MQATRVRRSSLTEGSAEDRREAQLLAQLQAEQTDAALRLDTLKAQIARADLPVGGAAGPQATVVQTATPPIERSPIGALLLWALIGFVAGMLIALVITVGRDRRLRLRDEIADAVGSTVLVSARSRAPRSVPQWTLLLQDYRPGPVDESAFRQLLRGLVKDSGANGRRGRIDHPRSVTIISLADDVRALAMGPQLASFTASLGVRTRLFLTSGQDTAAASLWTAFFAARRDDVRENLITGEVRAGEVIDLNIVLAILDRNDPQLRNTVTGGNLQTEHTLLAVAAGAATAEDLARLAVSLDDAGKRLDGIVVADPDPTDRTTGRQGVSDRSRQVALPMRLSGVPVNRPGQRKGVAG
jgi:hypothetical protein